MVTERDIYSVLRTVLDPEMPINVVDLGLIERVALELLDPADPAAGQHAHVDVLPTFVGCPALHVIERDVHDAVADLPGVERVTVTFRNDPPWSVERISDAGRAALQAFGVTTPARGSITEGPALIPLTIAGATEVVACPFCGSAQTELESRFGPTRCKMIYYCTACRNSFEHLKPV